MTKNRVIVYIILIVLAVLAVFLAFRPKAVSQTTNGVMLFTRNDCPHCQNVEAFIQQNKIEEKIKFENKEIHDADNAKLFMEKTKQCNLTEEQLVVPMIFDGQKCIIGPDNIINYFMDNTK